MSHLKEFENEDDMWKSLLNAVENGSIKEEELDIPNWGVSPHFLFNAVIDARAARQAAWMKPIIFLTGISAGMVGGALLRLEAPIYWLAF